MFNFHQPPIFLFFLSAPSDSLFLVPSRLRLPVSPLFATTFVTTHRSRLMPSPRTPPYPLSHLSRLIYSLHSHASRYFELYLPTGSIEIAHTSRYSHRTGKSELCILATRPLIVGAVITELKGSMADLTEEEDKELKRTDEGQQEGGIGIRRDFSVIHSKQLKKNHLFLGPARFVNVSSPRILSLPSV